MNIKFYSLGQMSACSVCAMLAYLRWMWKKQAQPSLKMPKSKLLLMLKPVGNGHYLMIADGLCVDALGGAPGIYSARYGNIHTAEGRRKHLLEQLKDIPTEERTAYFECVIVVASPDGIVAQTHGICHGSIALQEFDEGKGFGYDPLFIPDGYDKTYGQLDEMIKHELSHRGIAAKKMVEVLRNLPK